VFERFPPIDPYETGTMVTDDGHQIYWECCGKPDGRPVVFLHGGPGAGSSPGSRRYFDPELYRAVIFDQRGCGRSRPLASDPDADLSSNTTAHLVGDIEQLRQLLGIDFWTVVGVSWGTALALAYVQAHPERVLALLLALVGVGSRREVAWVTQGVGRIFPREWERFASVLPQPPAGSWDDSPVDLPAAYGDLLFDPDPDVREHAAREWCAWEDAHVSLAPGWQHNPWFDDPEFRMQFARLVTHYWRNGHFLEDEQLIRDAPSLNGIPGILIHGRYDVSGPLETALRLSRRWTSSELVIIDQGHGGDDEFPRAIIDGLDRLATRPRHPN